MEQRHKYPRTHHLPWSPGATDDDKILTTTAHFEGKQVVVTEKMDGGNCTIGQTYTHARSTDSRHHPSRAWVKGLQAKIGYQLPEGWRLCGENLFARASIGYENLPSFFLLFSVWNERNMCLSWRETEEWADLLDLKMVPVLYKGIWDEDRIAKLWNGRSAFGGKGEGYVVRLADSFPYNRFAQSVAKFVRPNHVETGADWMQSEIVQNKLKPKAASVAARWRSAKITVPPRDIRKYLGIFGRYAKKMREFGAAAKRLDRIEDGRYWLEDNTQGSSYGKLYPDEFVRFAERIGKKLDRMESLEADFDLFSDNPWKVVGWAQTSSEDLSEIAERGERLMKALRESHRRLADELDGYDLKGQDKAAAKTILKADKWWRNLLTLARRAPTRLKQLQDLRRGEPAHGKVEPLFHASLNARKLLRQGFKPGGARGTGLGGSSDTESGKAGVSFTYDFRIAKEIARVLKEGTLIAQGKVKAAKVLDWARRDGIEDKVKDTAWETWKNQRDFASGWESPEVEAMAYFLAWLTHGKRYNPWFWHGPRVLVQNFKRANYRDIGVLVADVNMDDPSIMYVPAEREYRVPIEAIVELKKVI